MKIKSEMKKLITYFGKGRNLFDKIYTFNFPHAKYTWEEKKELYFGFLKQRCLKHLKK